MAAQHPAFEKAIDENPLESSNHLVYADWLDENNEPDEAAFRRAMGEWVQVTQRRMLYDPGKYQNYIAGGKVGYPKGVQTNDPTAPLGEFNRPENAGAWNHTIPHHPTSYFGRLSDKSNYHYRWVTYRGMEEALRRSFMSNRQRTRMSRLYHARIFSRRVV